LYLLYLLPRELHHREYDGEELLVVAIGHRAVLQELQQSALDVLDKAHTLIRIQNTRGVIDSTRVLLEGLLKLLFQLIILTLEFLYYQNRVFGVVACWVHTW
jgi:hypothetical protein